MRYRFNIKSFKFTNKIAYLLLVNFHVIRNAINGISHLMRDYLGVPKYLYTFDFKIQLVSESLHKCFLLSYIVCAFEF